MARLVRAIHVFLTSPRKRRGWPAFAGHDGVVLAALLLALPAHAASPQDLLRAYPGQFAGFDGNDLIWRDGTRMPLGADDAAAPFEDQVRHGSIRDQLRLAYPATLPVGTPPEDDPGRIRNKAFFDKMYGDCHAGEVTPHLVSVTWLPSQWGHAVRITSVNNVDRHLAAISRELDALGPEYRKYLVPLGGTYACRTVADNGTPSMHGWGAAIDINTAFSDYWLWRRGGGYANREPAAIVAIFERHGFIWGGRWSHYDTMHFEYRPELLPGFDPTADEPLEEARAPKPN
ncbi:MAG: M15 family metallopeptidase [Proteobacteria bacterium]|nr:M15 family metallopeptidase [Pseudomonadota bacterium]